MILFIEIIKIGMINYTVIFRGALTLEFNNTGHFGFILKGFSPDLINCDSAGLSWTNNRVYLKVTCNQKMETAQKVETVDFLNKL